MIIDLSAEPGGSVPFEFEAAPELDEVTARVGNPLAVRGSVRTGEGRAEVEGHIEGVLACSCTRCLAPVERRIDLTFRDVFVTSDTDSGDAEAEIAGDDLDVSVIENESIDLDEIVREQVLLSIPEQLLCREDCRGICPICGADLNVASCDCSKEETDPRWAGLKDLKF